MKLLKNAIKKFLLRLGYEIKYLKKQPNDRKTSNSEDSFYRPLYCPWLVESGFQYHYLKCSKKTLVSPDRCFILFKTLLQALRKEGDVIECGVYKGGTAALMASCLKELNYKKKLYLFDTFEGMPETNSAKDFHTKGDFSDTSLESVMEFVGFPEIVSYRKGFLPATFKGLENASFCFAHVDVDIYRSILDALEFIWPRLVNGGIIVFDDYGFPTCPGAREAVDEYFKDTESVPLCLPTGQAIVFKS
jgi:O-methyltransferase